MGADASVYALSLAAVGTAIARKKRLARAQWIRPSSASPSVGLVEVDPPLRSRHRASRPDVDDRDVATWRLSATSSRWSCCTGSGPAKRTCRPAGFSPRTTSRSMRSSSPQRSVSHSPTRRFPDLAAGGIIFAVVANGARRILGDQPMNDASHAGRFAVGIVVLARHRLGDQALGGAAHSPTDRSCCLDPSTCSSTTTRDGIRTR